MTEHRNAKEAKTRLYMKREENRLKSVLLRKTSGLDIYSMRDQDMESRLVMDAKIQNRVKELRVNREWTQQELAEAVGVSRQSINSIERNRYVPSLLLALSFSRVFGCSTDDIFTLEIQP